MMIPNTPARLLLLAAAIVGAAAAGWGISAARTDRRRLQTHMRPIYDKVTGRLLQLDCDRDADGTIDARAYLDGARLLRVEIDRDEDGSTDRWEHYGPDRRLQKVGLSSAKDGAADIWGFPRAEGTQERIVFTANGGRRTRRVEFYEEGVIARAEEDSNDDGDVDRWESYARGALVILALDTGQRRAPDRRLVYDAEGTLVRVEQDPEGDGSFQAIADAPSGSAARVERMPHAARRAAEASSRD